MGISKQFTREELLRLVPREKGDFENVRALAKLGFPTIEPILPELFEWLQNGNWPIARELGPLVASGGKVVVPHVRNILAGEDTIWKYFLIGSVVYGDRELVEELMPDLLAIASTVPLDADEEYLQDTVVRLLEAHNNFDS